MVLHRYGAAVKGEILNAIVPAFIFGIAVVLFRSRVVRGQLWQAALIVPAFWVVYEYVTSIVSIHGTIGNTLQPDELSADSAACGGDWDLGHQLLDALFCGCGCGVVERRSVEAEEADISAGVLGCDLLYLRGWLWIPAAGGDAERYGDVKVGLIASDDSDMLTAATTDEAQHLFERFGKKIQSLAGQGIQVFVLPENSGPVTDASEHATDAMFEQLAEQTNAFIAVGVARIHRRPPGIRSGCMGRTARW